MTTPARQVLQSIAAAGMLLVSGAAIAQPHIASRVDIPFNRYFRVEEVDQYMRDLARAYPDLIELKSIGKTLQGRDIWLAIVNNSKTGPHTSKPAMYIEGSIHANEIQATEVVLYALWYLTKAQGSNAELTQLLENYSFYFVPIVNVDSRIGWFERTANPHFYRLNLRPNDDDRDGVADEDGFDDLDGDGSATQMWKADPQGRWMRDPLDPRIFRRIPDHKPAVAGNSWTFLGEEGLDNDNDGLINEDDPGGDDMNRNYPGDWQPPFIQFGAGPYPLSSPETRAVAEFILAHPNIAAVQSYHNTGGMILRGPGHASRESAYAPDLRVYDEIARAGEQMLPYYRYLVIHRDLYTVFGGMVTWTAESLGIISFTNELWTVGKFFQRDVNSPSEEQAWFWRDRMAFGELFTDYTEVDHPKYGKVLVGGLNKWSSRITPPFMLEEECHRNFAFTMLHAGEMPILEFARAEAEQVSPGVYAITAEVRNTKLIPTRTARGQQVRAGRNDLWLCEPAAGGSVVASGLLNSWYDERFTPRAFEPGRLQIESGVPGRSSLIARFLVTGKPGDEVTLRYDALTARKISTTVRLP